jgi:hypothetical protein
VEFYVDAISKALLNPNPLVGQAFPGAMFLVAATVVVATIRRITR